MKTIPGRDQTRCSAQARFDKGIGTVDPQPRGAETARNVGLGQSFHEIEPGGSDLRLLRVDHQLVSSTGG